MIRRVGLGSAMLLVAAALNAQEEKKTDAKDLLKQALEASAKAGGLRLEGKVENESPFAALGLQMGGMDGGISGKFTGVVGANGTVLVKVENDKGTYEFFKKKDKIVQRQTWTGSQVNAGEFPREAGALLGFAKLVKSVEKAKGLKQAADAKVGDVECIVVKGELPAGIVPEAEDDGNQQGFKFKMWELKKVEATIYIGKEDHLIRKIEAKLVKGMSSMIRANMPGGGKDDDEDEDDDDNGGGQPGMPNMAKMKTTSTYGFTISGYDKDLEVKIPEDVKKFFQE